MESEEQPHNSPSCERVFIQRDYSAGTAVRFQTLPMPFQLRNRITPSRFADAIGRLNKLFDEAETISSSVCLENIFGCLTAYLIFLCMKTHYDKVLRKVTLAVADLNEKLFLPNGLLMVDPSERGLRVDSNCQLMWLLITSITLPHVINRGISNNQFFKERYPKILLKFNANTS